MSPILFPVYKDIASITCPVPTFLRTVKNRLTSILGTVHNGSACVLRVLDKKICQNWHQRDASTQNLVPKIEMFERNVSVWSLVPSSKKD